MTEKQNLFDQPKIIYDHMIALEKLWLVKEMIPQPDFY